MTKKQPKKITIHEIQQILNALDEAYSKVGKKLETATLVDKIDDEGNVDGEVLVDNREDKTIH